MTLPIEVQRPKAKCGTFNPHKVFCKFTEQVAQKFMIKQRVNLTLERVNLAIIQKHFITLQFGPEIKIRVSVGGSWLFLSKTNKLEAYENLLIRAVRDVIPREGIGSVPLPPPPRPFFFAAARDSLVNPMY